MKLKICGMKYSNNILEVSKLEPDYMGFIFWDKSQRYCTDAIPNLPSSIQKVGVFVDANIDEIISKIKEYDLNLIQLHGKESVAFCNELRTHNILIIKAFSIDTDFDFNLLEEYESACDYYLFDTKGKLPGGNGIAFDWSILDNYNSNKPFFLSGGIGLDDVLKIKDFQYPMLSKNCIAIDVNSKFETAPGVKKIYELIEFKKMLHENEL
jgi:phosphoribosylanthranilate isomerase